MDAARQLAPADLGEVWTSILRIEVILRPGWLRILLSGDWEVDPQAYVGLKREHYSPESWYSRD